MPKELLIILIGTLLIMVWWLIYRLDDVNLYHNLEYKVIYKKDKTYLKVRVEESPLIKDAMEISQEMITQLKINTNGQWHRANDEIREYINISIW